MTTTKTVLAPLVLIGGAVMAAACSGGAAEPTAPPPTSVPTAEIDAVAIATTDVSGIAAIAVAGPAVQVLSGLYDEATFVVGVPAAVSFIAADSNGVSQVNLLVDGQVAQTWDADGEQVYKADLEWTPAVEGAHDVAVVVSDASGVPSQVAVYGVTILPAGSPTSLPPTAVAASPVPGATAAPKAVPGATPPPADTIPPAVSISAEDTTIEPGQDFDIYTNAVDELGVVRLELVIGGVVRDQWQYDGPPEDLSQSVFKTLIWRDVNAGEWDCVVRAWDSAGNVGESSPPIELKAEVSATATPLALPSP